MRSRNTPKRSLQSRRRRPVADRTRRSRTTCAPKPAIDIERFLLRNHPKIRLASFGAFCFTYSRSNEPSRCNPRKPSKLRLASHDAFSLRSCFIRTYDDGSRRRRISNDPSRFLVRLLASVRSPSSVGLEFTIRDVSKTRTSDSIVSLSGRSESLEPADRETFVKLIWGYYREKWTLSSDVDRARSFAVCPCFMGRSTVLIKALERRCDSSDILQNLFDIRARKFLKWKRVGSMMLVAPPNRRSRMNRPTPRYPRLGLKLQAGLTGLRPPTFSESAR